MNRQVIKAASLSLSLVVLAAWAGAGAGSGEVIGTDTNRGSIINTVHNLTQSFNQSPNRTMMDIVRSNYGEVCVYCHTPHVASGVTTAPLWNRTIKADTDYTTYSFKGSGSFNQQASLPGDASLTCLSCHDGTTAIDSIINMPGSGQFRKEQESTQLDSFLSSWVPPSGYTDAWTAKRHGTLYGTGTGCDMCHGDDPIANLPSFAAAYISTDLTDDHPVGVKYPDPNRYDFSAGLTIEGSVAFFDLDDDARADSNEVRLYDSGDGFEVECASCHDPHGVPINGESDMFTNTFLRVDNGGSQLCQVCHVK